MLQPQYSVTARLFHWVMAVLVLSTIPVGILMGQTGLDRALQNSLYIYHKNLGVLLLILVVGRLIWRLGHPAPAMPAHMPGWQARIAGLTHLAMYVLLFVIPIAGYVRVKAGGFPIESLDALGVPSLVPRSDALAETAMGVHQAAAFAMAAIIALHVGAALFHGIVKRDGVVSRMWPPFGSAPR